MADFAVSSYGEVVVYATQDGSITAIQVSVDGTWTPSSNPSGTPTAAPSPMPSLSALPTAPPSGSPTASPSGSPTMTALIPNGATPAPVSTVPSIAPSVAPLRGPSTTPQLTPPPVSNLPSEVPSSAPSEHFARALGHFAIDYQSTVGHTCPNVHKTIKRPFVHGLFHNFSHNRGNKTTTTTISTLCETVSNCGGQRQCGYCQLMMGNGPIATTNGHAGLMKTHSLVIQSTIAMGSKAMQ